MSKFYFLLICLFSLGFLSAQEKLTKEEKARRDKNIQAGNPFAKFGSKVKIATLSNGKYLEFHDLDSIVIIGTIRWHVYKNKIVGDIIIDSINPDARPIGDAAGLWISPDPLSEEFPSWSPYSFSFNNPIRFVDPDGRAAISSEWIPTIEETKDSNGKVNGGKLALKMEERDNAQTLSKTLGINQKEANKLFKDMQSNNSKLILVPESIAQPINNAIADIFNNPNNYEDSMFVPDSFETNYNCFESTMSISKGKTPNFNSIMAPFNFSSTLKTDYSVSSPSDYKFGSTIIRFGQDQKNIFGMISNISTHAATYLGTSSNGTIYTWSKNGMIDKPGIFTLPSLESLYGKNQGVGPTKNESGFYNKN
jgi:hypothetical protein